MLAQQVTQASKPVTRLDMLSYGIQKSMSESEFPSGMLLINMPVTNLEKSRQHAIRAPLWLLRAESAVIFASTCHIEACHLHVQPHSQTALLRPV